MSIARAPASDAGAGIGLRQPHYREVIEGTPPLAFVEVHSENFFGDGGAALAVLHEARERYPVSLHGVGLGLGSAPGIDSWHLERLGRLVERIEPVRVSDHASFARVEQPDGRVIHAGDLLPVAFTDAALSILCRNVETVQERLGHPILVENVSAYLRFADGEIAEPEFFTRLCRCTGCKLLLDVNNLMVNALNTGLAEDVVERCRAFVGALPSGSVGEIHVAGYAEGGALAIDDHGSRVRPAVWQLCAAALERFGPLPVLVEWDADLPSLDVLLVEAGEARRLVDAVWEPLGTPTGATAAVAS